MKIEFMSTTANNHRLLPPWQILAPVGEFPGISAAATGEMQLDWQAQEGLPHEACTLCFAAQEIADALHRIPGVQAGLTPWAGKLPVGPSVLLLAQHSFSPHRDILEKVFGRMEPPMTPQGFQIRTAQAGASGAYLILGADRVGALYGAYELLNRLGFQWFSPDPWDAEIPAALPNPLPTIQLVQAPSFETRGFIGGGCGDRNFLLWMARNKLNKFKQLKPEQWSRKIGIKLFGGDHDTFRRYAPPKKFFAQHPEWYGLRNGRRSNRLDVEDGDNICFSNGDVRAEIARALVEDLVGGVHGWLDDMNLMPFDNGKWCECGECAKMGNNMDRLLLLAHDCRQAIRRAMAAGRLNRNVRVTVPAYHETLTPPTRPLPDDFDHANITVQLFPIERCYVHHLDDPRCGEINAKLWEVLNAWKAPTVPFRGNIMIGEYFNVSTFSSMAIPFTRIMTHDLPLYWRTGVRHIDYMHVITRQWGTHALTNCQFAAQIWDHRLDVAAWLQQFFRHRYGNVAERMQSFHRLLEEALLNCKPLRHYVGKPVDGPVTSPREPLPGYTTTGLNDTLPQDGSPGKPNPIFTTQHLQYAPALRTENDGPSVLETMDLLHQADEVLDQALLECEDPKVSQRLAADARRFRYTRHQVRFVYYLVRLRMQENRGNAALAQVEAYALREVGETLRAEELMTKFNFPDEEYHFFDNGLTATWHPKTYARIIAKYFSDNTGSSPADPGKDQRLG